MKKLILLFAISLSCFAQQTSVYKTLWLNVANSQNNLSINNIGATSHQVYLITNDSGGTCGGTANIIASADSAFTTFVTLISKGFGGGVTNLVTTLQANGLYPYVGVSVIATNCTSSAYYFGSKAVIDPFVVQGQNASGFKQPLQQDNQGNLNVTSISGNTFTFITTNAGPVTFYNTSHNGFLGKVIVGLSGTGSTITIKQGANTILVIDTTKTGSYDIGLELASGVAYTYTTAGTGAANIALIGNFN